MRKRHVVALLACVIAVSFAMPAFGAPSPLKLAKRALKTANQAKSQARSAHNAATAAQNAAAGAQSTANAALGAAGKGFTSAAGPGASECADGGGACQVGSDVANCPAGQAATGGGFVVGSSSIDNEVVYAQRGPGSYAVISINYDASTTIQAQVVCAGGGGVTTASAHAKAAFKRDVARRLAQYRARFAQ